MEKYKLLSRKKSQNLIKKPQKVGRKEVKIKRLHLIPTIFRVPQIQKKNSKNKSLKSRTQYSVAFLKFLIKLFVNGFK